MVWMDSRNGTFCIKVLYSVLNPKRSIPFLVEVIWNSQVPFKASFFLGRQVREKF